MKNLTSRIFIPVCIFLCVSCEKFTTDCDINGFWYGTWESDQEASGTFVVEVSQDKTHFSGDIGIQIFTDVQEGYSTDFTGRIRGSNFSSEIFISAVEVSVEGDVQDDQYVEGEFKVQFLDMNGTFSGELLPSGSPVMTEIYSLEPETMGESINDILCIGDEIWIFKYPPDYIGEENMNEVIVTDFDGNVTGTRYFPTGGYDYSYDGQYIWTINNGTTLYKRNVDGTLEDMIEMPFHSFHLTGDGQNLYFPAFNGAIISTDMDLNITDTIPFRYLQQSCIIRYKDHLLSAGYRSMFESDLEGNLTHAYSLNINDYASKLVTNNEDVFMLVREYVYNDTGGARFFVYRIDMD